MIETNDLIGLLIVYLYVIILLIITEKVIKNLSVGRKILHIMVGNIAFILPVFATREIMVFIAAAPFIVLTFLISPYTPIKSIRGKTSSAGHSMGLVYYSVSWTVLAYLFFNNMVVIAIGIFAMSYGDGFASLIGIKYGKQTYNIAGDRKSFIGTFSMFFFTFIMMIIAIIYYQNVANFQFTFSFINLGFLLLFSSVGAIVEGFTPKGFDNITVPLILVFMFWVVFLQSA
jgi:phytol kinase